MPRTNTFRVEFTKEHDTYLVKYLARYCPSKEGRSGRKVFERLIANEQKLWPWSVHHTWQSWRERYVKNSGHFDALISKYQAKHDLGAPETRKRGTGPIPVEMLGSSAKRVKLAAKEEEEEEEESSSSDTRTRQAVAVQHTNSSSKSTSTSVPKMPPHKPDVGTSSSQRPSTSTNIDTTNEPTPDHITRDGAMGIPSSPPKQVPPPVNEPELLRPAKQLKKRPRVPSEVFASEPSSPTRNPAVVGVGSPSSQTLPAPPSTVTEGAPVSTPIYPRAPPRVVDSLHGQVLVDRKGHAPRAFPQDRVEEEEGEGERKGGKEKEKEEAEKAEDNVQWPPPRGHSAKKRMASEPDIEADPHHAFSQFQPQPRPPEDVPRQLDAPERRAIVAQFVGEVRHEVESGRHEDLVPTRTPPVERTAPPAPDQPSGLVPKSTSKVLKFPAPRASTMSPFRPESPVRKTRHAAPVPQPHLRPQSWTKVARHQKLTRIRRQAMENGRDRRPEHAKVPSIDLVALSRSSTSARSESHSRSSTGTSAPARPPRYSLPAFTHAAPWVLDEPRAGPSAQGSMLSSGSGSPFRWVPSAVYGYGDRAGTSSPRFVLTPSPARSVTAVATDGTGPPHGDAARVFPVSPALTMAPHPPDVSLTASHGLASILAHMSANHGLALGVVEAVYKRVRSLKDADEVLRGMKEAAEGFGEREIERRVRERKRRGRGGREKRAERTSLRYVVASEDGEGSEYSPPETSRAAMWKRHSEAVMCADEVEEEEGAVEEELRVEDGDDDEELFVAHHGFSQHVPALDGVNDVEKERNDGGEDALGPKEARKEERTMEEALVEHLPAQELERKMGRRQFRKDIVRRFV